MNGKKAKKLRREIFGELSFRHPAKYLRRGGTIVVVGPWKAYREAKKKA
jgi:hypothetical protein